MKFIARLGIATGIASRFVAGMTLREAVRVVKKLNAQGFLVTLDDLGENVTTKKEAKRALDTYKRIVEKIHEEKLDSKISVKLTMLGLDLGDDVAHDFMVELLQVAKRRNTFVRIDMEGSDYTERTLQIFYKLRKKFSNVGIVLQAMLYRTAKDVDKCIKMKAPVRIVKGAYLEPEEIAFQDKDDVNKNYRKLLNRLLSSGNHTAIATHDVEMVEYAKSLLKKYKTPKSKYEFQMLYGIARPLQKQMVGDGYKIRIYVPYGEQYIPYYYRRLRERKENVFFVLKHMFG